MAKLRFNLPNSNNVTGIKVIGVGGGGSNAVTRMFQQGIEGVEYIICNTDLQALNDSPVPVKIQLGPTVSGGLGCGADWEKGKEAAEEVQDEIKKILEKGRQSKTDMVIITAGMGGGTGTGAAPVIAKIAKDMGILTIAIVTTPFKREGKPRMKRALIGIENLKKHVDGILIISNEKLLEQEELKGKTYPEWLLFADEILFRAAKGIAEIITKPGVVNVDFADVKRALQNAGTIYMSTGKASGKDRAKKALDIALNSPLVENFSIANSKVCVYNIIGNDVLGEEVNIIAENIIEVVGEDCEIIGGHAQDAQMGEELEVILIATGFPVNDNNQFQTQIQMAKKNGSINSSASQDNTITPQPETYPPQITHQNTPHITPKMNNEPHINEQIQNSSQIINQNLNNETHRTSGSEQSDDFPKSIEDYLNIPDVISEETLRKLKETPAYYQKKT